MSEELKHPDDVAVDSFALAMKRKLKWEREERGRMGWDNPAVCSDEHLANLLMEHLEKGNSGNFEDVANFCMMLHQRGAHPRVLADIAAWNRRAPSPDMREAVEALAMPSAIDELRAAIEAYEANWIALDGYKPAIATLLRIIADEMADKYPDDTNNGRASSRSLTGAKP